MNSFELIAFASLKHNGESVDKENIEYESLRLQRVISDQYVKMDHNLHYNDFVKYFIKNHGRDFVFTDEFTYDPQVPDEPYELNVNVMIDKYNRKRNA